jgi:glycoprotein 6-alpha-L-fucosyltransferase
MQINRSDNDAAASAYHSLDSIYYFSDHHPHQQIVIVEHRKENDEEIDLMVGVSQSVYLIIFYKIGDVINIDGNMWNGYLKGYNTRTAKSGLYPSYKVTEKWCIETFPVYNSVYV